MKWYEIDIYEDENGELSDRMFSRNEELAMKIAKTAKKEFNPARVEINRCFGNRNGETFDYDNVELVEVL